MKRKVIQIANSTHLVSLPRKWALRNNIKKGQEVEVTEEGERLIISNDSIISHKTAEVDITNLDVMTSRVIHALYKKGVDELRITYSDPKMIELVQDSLGKESQGFEILEHGKNSCVVKHVGGSMEEFNPLLKRTFLLLIDMAEQISVALKAEEYDRLKVISHMEETNNRFTTICRRYLNSFGQHKFEYVGPLYYIVEDLENIADQFKYICFFYYDRRDENIKITKSALKVFDESNRLLRFIFDAFYKLEMSRMIDIKKTRQALVDEAFILFQKNKNPGDTILLHHSIVIMQKVFCLMGPILILNLKDRVK